MKVGDLVGFKPDEWSTPTLVQECGIVVKLSRTGHKTKSAQVLFNDGEIAWVGTDTLVVMSESR
tara:strand:+ start:706 stop:897 length:192 start_codon:yes stop_codon:yes gene_type:complete